GRRRGTPPRRSPSPPARAPETPRRALPPRMRARVEISSPSESSLSTEPKRHVARIAEIALDQLGQYGRDGDLNVPLLSELIGVDRHVLAGQREPHRHPAHPHHLP